MLNKLIDWYEDMLYKREAQRRWRRATTYQQALNINTDHLRTLRDRAIGGDEPFSMQIALNLLGIFTITSHAALPDLGVTHGPWIDYRNAVVVLANDEMRVWLEETVRGLNMATPLGRVLEDLGGGTTDGYALHVCELREPTTDGPQGIPVSRVFREDHFETLDILGRPMTAGELHQAYPVQPDAAAQMHRAWQITIYDRRWGADSRLFADLERMANRRGDEIVDDLLGASENPALGGGWSPSDPA